MSKSFSALYSFSICLVLISFVNNAFLSGLPEGLVPFIGIDFPPLIELSNKLYFSFNIFRWDGTFNFSISWTISLSVNVVSPKKFQKYIPLFSLAEMSNPLLSIKIRPLTPVAWPMNCWYDCMDLNTIFISHIFIIPSSPVLIKYL